MKHIFLDTNVLLDFFADRDPFSLDVAHLFDYALKEKIMLYVSADSYNNIYYIMRQSCSHSEAINMLVEMNEWTDVIDVSKEVVQSALKSNFRDFEDAIQYNCARMIKKVDFIVTRGTKRFKTSSLPVLNPKEALALIKSVIKK